MFHELCNPHTPRFSKWDPGRGSGICSKICSDSEAAVQVYTHPSALQKDNGICLWLLQSSQWEMPVGLLGKQWLNLGQPVLMLMLVCNNGSIQKWFVRGGKGNKWVLKELCFDFAPIQSELRWWCMRALTSHQAPDRFCKCVYDRQIWNKITST